jgi:hypothetical protein
VDGIDWPTLPAMLARATMTLPMRNNYMTLASISGYLIDFHKESL